MKNKFFLKALLVVLPFISVDLIAQDGSISGICEVTFNIGDDVTICSSSSFYALPQGFPAGGTYSGTGVLDDFFLANLAGTGQHIITYSYDNGVCAGTASDTITVVTPIPLIVDGDMELCFGESTVITALNGEDLEWESGSNATSEIHQPAVTTNYSVYGFDVNGCLTAAGYTIIVHPLPDVQITGDTILCLGETSILTAIGAQDYVWSDASTDQTLFIDNLIDQSYGVTGTDEFGCVNDDIIIVTVHDYPDVTATEIIYGCPGEELLLQADGAQTYEWSVGGNESFVYITPVTSQNVSVIGTNEFGCSDEALTQVVIYPVPVFEITGDLQICAGEFTELSASGEYAFVWSNGGLESSINVSPESTALYIVTAQNEFGCQAIDDAMVIVYDLPEIVVNGDAEICLGEVTSFTASGATDYLWSTDETGEEIIMSPATSDVFNVIGTDDHGCSNTTTFEVVVHALPSFEILGNAQVCEGSMGEFNVVGSDTYVWNNVTSANDFSLTITENTVITVDAENTFGCTSHQELEVTSLELPLIEVSGDLEICESETTTIMALGGVNYIWYDESMGEMHDITGTTTQLYTVTGTGENGCSNSTSFTLLVHETQNTTIDAQPLNDLCVGDVVTLTDPNFENSFWQILEEVYEADTLYWTVSSTLDILSLRSLDQYGCYTEWVSQEINALAGPEINISGDLEICSGESTTIIASGSDNYIWSNDQTGDTIEVNPTDSTEFTVSSSNGTCTTTLQFAVNVVPIPELSVFGDMNICLGESTFIEVFGASSYWWSGELQGDSQELNPTQTTTYLVEGYNNEECFAEISLTITVDSVPIIQITGLENPVCYGTEQNLYATGGVTYLWNNEATGSVSTLIPETDVEISVVGTDGNGCSNSTSVQIDVIDQVELSFELADTVCVEDGIVTLSASPVGGIFSGDGIQNTNEFNPGVVDAFTHVTLTYNYTDEFGCENTDTEVVFVELCSGVKENAWVSFDMFPNPAHDVIQFRSSEMIESFVIYDAQGKVVQCRDRCQSRVLSENIDHLSNGLYTVEMKTVSGFTCRRPFLVD